MSKDYPNLKKAVRIGSKKKVESTKKGAKNQSTRRPAVTELTMSALVKRINLELAHKGQQLKRPRGESSRSNLGDYYVLNLRDNFVVARYVKPATLGRQLGLLVKVEPHTRSQPFASPLRKHL